MSCRSIFFCEARKNSTVCDGRLLFGLFLSFVNFVIGFRARRGRDVSECFVVGKFNFAARQKNDGLKNFRVIEIIFLECVNHSVNYCFADVKC